jgi:hypothetical protein
MKSLLNIVTHSWRKQIPFLIPTALFSTSPSSLKCTAINSMLVLLELKGKNSYQSHKGTIFIELTGSHSLITGTQARQSRMACD